MTVRMKRREITRADILPMQAYEAVRASKRAEMRAAKRNRQLGVGPHAMFTFESYDSMWLQVHEMLRIEKGGDAQIDDELAAYNPMIPEPGQLCATLFIELTSNDQMREWLPKLVGIEKSLVMVLADGSKVRCVVDEQHAEGLTRETVTAAVHYVRFDFTPSQVETFAKGGVQLRCDLSNYLEAIELPDFTVTELLTDLRDDA